MNEKPQKKKSTAAWILDFIGPAKGYFVFSIITAILSVACGFVPYIIISRMVNGLLDGTATLKWCMMLCLIMAGLWICNRVFHSVSTTTSHKTTFEVLAQVRRRLTRKLAKMPLGDVLSESSGSYKNIIIERVDSCETTLAHMIPEVTSNLLIPVIIFIYMLTINWQLTLIALIPVPVGMIFFALMMRGSTESFNNTIVKTKALNDTAVEYINGIEVIKAFGKSKTSYERFVIAAKEGADCFIEWMRRCNFYENAALVLMPAQLLTLLPFSGYFYMTGKISGSDLLVLIILAIGLVAPIIIASGYMDDMKKMQSIFGEVASILEKPELVRPATLTAEPKESEVRLNGVHFGYKDEEVLHGVDITIKEGTVNALVGPSGSGKSTIAKLIASFWDVDEGSVTFGGVNIKDIPLEEYNKRIAYVSQDNYLFDVSVMENIRMGNPKATDEQVINAAKMCGCHEFIMQLENGYDTVAGGAGSHLSGGERQRISIARAMLKDAPLIILDEATAYTDPENEAIIQRSVAKLIAGKTLIVIAHRLSTIASADCIFLVNKGKIDCYGTQEELLSKSPMYKDMWDAHMAVKEGA